MLSWRTLIIIIFICFACILSSCRYNKCIPCKMRELTEAERYEQKLKKQKEKEKKIYEKFQKRLSDLRKQFLIWRSISPELMEQYRLRTLNVVGKFEKDRG